MTVVSLTESRREAWDAFAVQQPSFAMVQSWEWGEFKEKLGWRTLRIVIEEQGRILAGAQMLIKPIPSGLLSIAYVPKGPLGNWQDKTTMSKLLAELVRVARQHKAIFLRIEPAHLNDPAIDQFLCSQEFRANPYTNQPRATIILDLTPDLDDILKQMRKKTRQYIKRATRKGVTVRVGGRKDLPAFYELMQITGRRSGFSPRIRDYYEYEWQTLAKNGQGVLFLAYYQDQLLAGRIAFHFGKRAAEFHAGSSNEHVDLRPNYLLVWEAIKWAKAQGCCTYDLWGIPDQVGQAVCEGKDLPKEEHSNGLWGVYRFKRGFGNNVVYYVGAHDYVFSRPLYWLATNRLLKNSTLDTIATRLDLLRGIRG
jgi:peptidoglycan pentaglycine glycine transferase (the first glycine)